jgi:hypothetical protein
MGRDLTNTTRKTRRHEPAGLVGALIRRHSGVRVSGLLGPDG